MNAVFGKIMMAVFGAGLVFLLLNFFSGQIYGTGEGGHHGDEVLAFAIEIESGDEAASEPEEVDLASLIASGDAGKGEKVFNKCKACHKIEDGANGVGPHLWGVIGRDIGSVDGYAYSGALADLGGTWDLAAMDAFLESPKGYAAGTKMAFAGLSSAEDRINLIIYLNDADGSPEPLE
ncbi:MAG: cytochrome c family protein [Pseudomonadota bacterium]